MKLSEHFDLSEFTTSQTAARRGIDNTPNPAVMANLRRTASALEAVRTLLGKPLLISSGYRSPDLNKVIGGAPTSAHVQGFAADFICPGFGDPLAICHAIRKSGLKFDQVIEEGTWVHISFDPRMRGEVLSKTAGGYAMGLAA
jgi:zinc D-Ala-D-Ala carboxypeptidase